MAPSATTTLTTAPASSTITAQPPQAATPKPSTSGVLNWNVSNGAAPSALHVIPTFTDKHAERAWAKQHMAAAFRTFARLDYADGASGHVSLRDPVDPELFWISKCGGPRQIWRQRRIQTYAPR